MDATAGTLYAEEGGRMSWEDVDDDRCYECTGYGDAYSIDEEGNLVSNCTDCPYNSMNWED